MFQKNLVEALQASTCRDNGEALWEMNNSLLSVQHRLKFTRQDALMSVRLPRKDIEARTKGLLWDGKRSGETSVVIDVDEANGPALPG